MTRFAERTGLASSRPSRRYLWTDAFAVCNFLGLARATGEARYQDLARSLVDAVHRVLGRHREDDRRTGWLSGMSESEGVRQPTAGGLRIGKPLPERELHEHFDPELEWNRDGQYFHYLTKWMHALDQVSRHTGDPKFNGWARDLARTAHDAFVQGASSARSPRRMIWKMSIDLTRPLVPSMGQHDPLDGFVTATELEATAAAFSKAAMGPTLAREIESFGDMVDVHGLATTDPLGLGGLLMDACRVAQLSRKDDPSRQLLDALLAVCAHGLSVFGAGAEMDRQAESRLAFRELGLSIGLKAIPLMHENAGGDRHLLARLEPLRRHEPLGAAIDSFWLDPNHHHTRSWTAHLDINEVMLATSLVPDGLLDLSNLGGGPSKVQGR